MTRFSRPEFAKLSPRIDRVARELSQMEQYYTLHAGEVAAGDWGALAAVSSGIHNVYNGIEDIPLSIARDVDGYVPTGGSAHQDILDLMAAEIAGTRPALLGPQLYEALLELKGFRHLVRHKYGFDLKPEKVSANYNVLKSTFPAFIEAVVALERSMIGKDAGGAFVRGIARCSASGPCTAIPPSALPGISPSRGEIDSRTRPRRTLLWSGSFRHDDLPT